MEQDYEVKKVLLRTDGIKYIIIPKDSKIIAGEYVIIKKLKHQEVK